MLQIKELLDAGYKFTQKLVFEYPFEQQKDFDNETLLTNPCSIMLDIIEDGYGEEFITFMIEINVPETDYDSSYLIDAYQEEMIEILDCVETVEEFKERILNIWEKS